MTTIGDTVTVDGERGSAPVPLPLSLSAVLAACEATLAAQAAMLTPTAFGAAYAAWVATLPVYSGSGPAPVPSGEYYSNGGWPTKA